MLFYGQSFSEQGWWRDVASALKRRYPHAVLEIENRALGGFPAQLLVKTAETDIYPYYPDLLVFHAFGAHDKYEDLVRGVRERTTAEILLQNDYVMRAEDLAEGANSAHLGPRAEHWDAFMNHSFLPELARKYGTALCDHRGDFKAYLRAHDLLPEAMLLSDGHLNPFGEWLVTEEVSDCLREHAPQSASAAGPPPSQAWIQSYRMGDTIEVKQGRIRFSFRGNRVDAILAPGGTLPARVWIDGRPPSSRPELYTFTRALATPGGKWPALLRVRSHVTPRLETWSLDVVRGERSGTYAFSLHGSRTGFDGSGSSEEKFVSNSGRVVIEAEDWSLEYALALAGIEPVPARVSVRFFVQAAFVDRVMPGKPDAMHELTVTLAQGLSNTEHVLEVESAPNLARIRELRVYAPPGASP